MTKEEILNKHDSSRKYIEQTCRPELFSAMDEYAKQQAIAYSEWYNSIGYLPKVKNKEDHKPGENYMKSHEELYEDFIEQQNKR